MKLRSHVTAFFLFLVLIPGLGASGAGWARTANTAPVISGTPPTTAVAGRLYSFVPQAFDANGDRLLFTVANKPAWAAFDRRTGRLSGTPTTAQAGSYAGISIRVSDRLASASLAPFTITVTAPPATNTAPTISGTPATSVRAGAPYAFVPTAHDAEGDVLTFSILNPPAWALFSPTTGALIGTPTGMNVGTTANVVIRVSDGRSLVSLPAFDLTVVPANDATLSWIAPSTREDGSALALTDIAGYRIYHGPASDQLTLLATDADAAATRYTVQNLVPGIHYFAVSVYDTNGSESALSASLWKAIQ
jgi:hypothetical protein